MEATRRRSGILAYHCYNKPELEVISISSTEDEPQVRKLLPTYVLKYIARKPREFELSDTEFGALKQQMIESPATSKPSVLDSLQQESRIKVHEWSADFTDAYQNEYEDCEKESYEKLRDQVIHKKNIYQPHSKLTKPKKIKNGMVNGVDSSKPNTPLSPETTKRNEFYSYLQIGAKPSVNSDGILMEPNRRSVRLRNISLNKERERSISQEFKMDTQDHEKIQPANHTVKEIPAIEKIGKNLSPIISNPSNLKTKRKLLKQDTRYMKRRKRDKHIFQLQNQKTDKMSEPLELGFSQFDKTKSEKSGQLLRLVTKEINASIHKFTNIKESRREIENYFQTNGSISVPLNNNNVQKRKEDCHEKYESLNTKISEVQKKIIDLTINYSFSDCLSGDSEDSFHGFGPEPCKSICDSTSVSYISSIHLRLSVENPIKITPIMSPQTIKAFNMKKSPKSQPCQFGSNLVNWPLVIPEINHTPHLRQSISQKLIKSNQPQTKEQYSIDIEKSDGEISSIHFVNSTLIIAQDMIISFWDQTPLGTMLKSQNMWMNWGKVERLKLEIGCLSISSKSQTCFSSDNVVAYIEIWGKEHKSEKRERPITDIFATIYFHQMKGNILQKKVIQLENIVGFTEDVKYATLKHNRTIIVSWRDQFADPSQVTQIRKYQLALDFQTVSNVTELPDVEHYISALHTVKDCSDMILGVGDFNVSIWQLSQRQLVTTVVINSPRCGASLASSPRRDFDINCLWASCDRGYLFLINKTESNNCLNLIAISGFHTDWKSLQVYRIPSEYHDISTVSVEGGILSAISQKGIVCWSIETGTILLECPAGSNIKLFASNLHISLIDQNFNVTFKNLFQFLLED